MPFKSQLVASLLSSSPSTMLYLLKWPLLVATLLPFPCLLPLSNSMDCHGRQPFLLSFMMSSQLLPFRQHSYPLALSSHQHWASNKANRHITTTIKNIVLHWYFAINRYYEIPMVLYTSRLTQQTERRRKLKPCLLFTCVLVYQNNQLQFACCLE